MLNEEDLVNDNASRSVIREGLFVLPYLKRNMSILEVGCGSGSISSSLARFVNNGSVIGIDIDRGAIEQASESYKSIANLRFEEADVNELYLPSDSFDLVFCHNFFMHIDNHEKALSELIRVSKPGALIATREGLGSYENTPDFPLVSKYESLSRLLKEVAKLSGIDPGIGTRLNCLLHKLNFSKILITSSSEVYDKPSDIQQLSQWYKFFIDSKVTPIALKHDLLSISEINTLVDSIDEWQRSPSTLIITNWIEYVATFPKLENT